MSKAEKIYGWCQNCGALVFGSLKCHKCDGEVKTFCVDIMLVNLKQQRDDLLQALKYFPDKLDSQTNEQFYNCCTSWIRTHKIPAITKARNEMCKTGHLVNGEWRN